MQADRETSDPQVKNTHTLAAMIEADLKAIFRQGMKNLGALGVPGDTMYYYDIRDRTNFGQLLHKEGLWSLYKFDECRSLLYHLCRGYLGLKQENYPAEPGTGQCTGCNTEAPDEIRGLWTLHNFDWVQLGGELDV